MRMKQNTIKRGLTFFLLYGIACSTLLYAAKHKTSLQIDTDPPGAKIFINGELKGSSPYSIQNIQPGEYLIMAQLEGFYEERRSVVVAQNEIEKVSIRLEPMRGLLLIHSDPFDADVEIDGNYVGKTPLLLTELAIGKKEIVVSKQGYISKKIEATLLDRTPKKINVTLTGNYGTLFIESIPAGAQIIVDGSLMGNTPATLERVATGEHTVELLLEGAARWQQKISLVAGGTSRVSAQLVMLPAKIKVYSVPQGAKIIINNNIVGTSAVEQIEVKAGEVQIGAELKGYDASYKMVNLKPGETASFELKLEKSSGTLLIATEPPGVNVFLDGELCGITPEQSGKGISEQMRIESVSKGEHKLLLTRSGYYDKTITFQIAPKETLTFSEKLTPRPVAFVPDTIVRIGEGGAYSTYRGVLKEKYPNGDIKMEVSPGIYKVFRLQDILSIEPITNRFEPKR